MKINIPGLIARENSTKESERQLVSQAKENMKTMGYSDEYINQQLDKAMKASISAKLAAIDKKTDDHLTWGKATPRPSIASNQVPSGYIAATDPYWDQWKQATVPSQPMHVTMEDLQRIAGITPVPKKTALEELIDGMFDGSEKEQILMDLGYEFYTNERGQDEFKRNDTVWNRKMDLERVFMKEIKIKFKNVLLSKQTLKFKF